MKRILFAASALAIAGAAALTPASAQVYFGADRGGVGVQVGPVGAGIGPYWDGRYHHRYWHDYAYAPGDCRLIRERIVTPGGPYNLPLSSRLRLTSDRYVTVRPGTPFCARSFYSLIGYCSASQCRPTLLTAAHVIE